MSALPEIGRAQPLRSTNWLIHLVDASIGVLIVLPGPASPDGGWVVVGHARDDPRNRCCLPQMRRLTTRHLIFNLTPLRRRH